MNNEWIRVSRSKVCPICERPDWCMVAADESAAICARVKSSQPAGNKGAGWVHKLRDNDWQPPRWRSPKRVKPEPPTKRMRDLALANCRALRQRHVAWLAGELGVSVDSLLSLGIGWSERWKAFSFPMRYPSGNVSGIRYRPISGKKFSEPGSKDGMFFQPEGIERSFVAVVEGASDAAALMDLGFQSVLGRASCRGNVEQILTLARRKRAQQVLIIPDNDEPGIAGSNSLRANLESVSAGSAMAGSMVQVLHLPDGVNDVRQCVQDTKNAEWLAGELGKVCGWKPQDRKESRGE